jgi:signal transduction histidine kinase
VERLSGLVDGLLALARSEASEQGAEPLDLAALVRSRAEAWSALLDEREVRLETATDGPVVVRAGEARLEQVLDNLLSNALEVSPPGSRIRVAAHRNGARVELHVTDEGPGMSETERARAFDRFWRAGGGEGSGLGLAIVQRLVATDDGEVELRAAAPHGLDAVVLFRPA